MPSPTSCLKRASRRHRHRLPVVALHRVTRWTRGCCPVQSPPLANRSGSTSTPSGPTETGITCVVPSPDWRRGSERFKKGGTTAIAHPLRGQRVLLDRLWPPARAVHPAAHRKSAPHGESIIRSCTRSADLRSLRSSATGRAVRKSELGRPRCQRAQPGTRSRRFPGRIRSCRSWRAQVLHEERCSGTGRRSP